MRWPASTSWQASRWCANRSESLLPAGDDVRSDPGRTGRLAGAGSEGEIVYDLRRRWLSPIVRGARSLPSLSPLPSDALLYAASPIRWVDWVQTWQLDHDGKGHARCYAKSAVVAGSVLLAITGFVAGRPLRSIPLPRRFFRQACAL